MTAYLTSFIFYTLAMIGIMLIGFVVYKKISPTLNKDNKGMIKVLDSLPIGNKKVLLVVKIKNEKFLIASGLEHTTFLSKLNDDNQQTKKQTKSQTPTSQIPQNSTITQVSQMAVNNSNNNKQNYNANANDTTNINYNDLANNQLVNSNLLNPNNLSTNELQESQKLAQAWNDIQTGVKNVNITNLNEIQSLIQAQKEYLQNNNKQTIESQILQKRLQQQEPTKENIPQHSQVQNEFQQARLQKLQRKFNDLYNEESAKVQQTILVDNQKNQEQMHQLQAKTNKQKLIKHLLEELNADSRKLERQING